MIISGLPACIPWEFEIKKTKRVTFIPLPK
jgi:hypothetical protein